MEMCFRVLSCTIESKDKKIGTSKLKAFPKSIDSYYKSILLLRSLLSQ